MFVSLILCCKNFVCIVDRVRFKFSDKFLKINDKINMYVHVLYNDISVLLKAKKSSFKIIEKYLVNYANFIIMLTEMGNEQQSAEQRLFPFAPIIITTVTAGLRQVNRKLCRFGPVAYTTVILCNRNLC